MVTEARLVSDLPVPPGELLAETFETLGLSQAEAARRMGRPVQAINEIVKAKKEITPETALQLERVLGVPAHIWLGLEAAYRQALARRADARRLARETPGATAFPYAAMAALGWVPKISDASSRVANLLQFFGVASLGKVPQAAVQAAYRVARARRGSTGRPSSAPALAAWLRKGEIEALRLETRPFDATRLRDALPALRALTTRTDKGLEDALRARLADCGVAFVVVPHLPGTRAHGAARWLSPRKALVQMSLRGRWADVFWFRLFHELGHVLLHGRRAVFIEWDAGARNALETEADALAAEHLIPPKDYDSFIQQHPRPAGAAVVAFAARIGVAPGIVVGRLQHDRHLPHSHLNGIRSRLPQAS